MEAKIYDKTGKETGRVKLPESVFGLSLNTDLLHQVVRTMELNRRTPVAHTKDRSEVSGTGKKPWRQKGTGRARHGSRRSPIWRTGGVAHGPRNEKKYSGKINKKVKAKALYIALSEKLRDKEILFVDALSFPKPATKEAKVVLDSLAKIKGYEGLGNKKTNRVLFSLSNKDKTLELSFKNFGNIKVGEIRSLNPVEVLKYKYLVIIGPEESIKTLEARLPSLKKETRPISEKAPVKKITKKMTKKSDPVKTKSSK